jgi:hypothetical protein
MMAMQCVGYLTAARGAIKGEEAGKLSRVANTFVIMNAAAVEGLRRYLVKDFKWSR